MRTNYGKYGSLPAQTPDPYAKKIGLTETHLAGTHFLTNLYNHQFFLQRADDIRDYIRTSGEIHKHFERKSQQRDEAESLRLIQTGY